MRDNDPSCRQILVMLVPELLFIKNMFDERAGTCPGSVSMTQSMPA
jgi:hypothetical protein